MCGIQARQRAGGVVPNVLDVADHVALLVVAGGLAPVKAHAPVGDARFTGTIPAG